MRYSKKAHCPPPLAKKKPPIGVRESTASEQGKKDRVAMGSGWTCELADMMSTRHTKSAAKDTSEMMVMSPNERSWQKGKDISRAAAVATGRHTRVSYISFMMMRPRELMKADIITKR